MRTLGLIPARAQSRRFPRKNLALLEGTTLVRRALLTALSCDRLDVVALSSEDPEILAEAADLDEVVCVERPPELATAEASSHAVVAHALDVLEGQLGRFDSVALLQCTAPFTTHADIAGTLDLLERTGAGSAITVTRVPAEVLPARMLRMHGDRLRPLLDPAPDGEAWVRNAAVYAVRRATVHAGTLISDDVVGYPMPRERSVDINEPLDLALAAALVPDLSR